MSEKRANDSMLDAGLAPAPQSTGITYTDVPVPGGVRRVFVPDGHPGRQELDIMDITRQMLR